MEITKLIVIVSLILSLSIASERLTRRVMIKQQKEEGVHIFRFWR